MSLDSIDDLIAAEEVIGELNAQLRELDVGQERPFCRPSCLENSDYAELGETTHCDDEVCGCPCHSLDNCTQCGQDGERAKQAEPTH